MIQKFNFDELDLKDAFIIDPFIATDERGLRIRKDRY